MELGQIKLLALLKNRSTISNEDIIYLKEKIALYKHPLGLIPAMLLSYNEAYKDYTFTDNITYFHTLTSRLFKNIYSNDEIHIIDVFLAKQCSEKFILDNEKQSVMFTLLKIDSTKEEIQYCLDEIRYIYLYSLIE